MKLLHSGLLLLVATLALADNPESFPLLGGLPGGTEQAVVVGDHAYAATYGGLLVLDVSDPSRMTQVALVPLPGWGRRVAVSDGLACVLSYDAGLTIIDVHEPTMPVVLGACDDVPLGGGVAVDGAYAYVANRTSGLVVIDIADPAAPAPVTSLSLAGELYALSLAGDLVFVAANDQGLHVVDVSDPLAPAWRSTASFPGVVRDVAVVEDLAYLAAGSSGLRILDVSDPTQPVEVSQLPLFFDYTWAQFAQGISVADGVACLGLGQAGLGMVDVADPVAPAEVALHVMPGSALTSDRHGGVAYVAMYNGGLAAVDLSEPKLPVDLGWFWLLGDAADLDVAAGLVYVAGGYGWPEEKQGRVQNLAGLFVVDAQQPASPAIVGHGAAWYQSPRLTLSGERVYLSVPFGGVRIFDVADPTAPAEVGFVFTAAEMYKVAAAGDLLYHYEGNEFVVTDVSDPASPTAVGRCEVGYYGHLTAAGDHVYSVSGYPGLLVFDVRDPAQPEQIAQLAISGSASASSVVNDHIHVANGPHGLLVIDVRDPANPVAVGSQPLPGIATGVACRWPYAYVAAHDVSLDAGGVHVVDITDPAAPALVTSSEEDTEVMAVAVEGTRVYAAATWGGVLVFEHDVTTGTLLPAPAAARLLSNHPNPFNPRTTIRWEQPVAGRAEVTIFDPAGHRVRTLVDEVRAAGRQRVEWDGRDGGGRAMSSGVYLYRLRAGGVEESRSLTLVR